MAARLGRKLRIYIGDTSPQDVIQGAQQKTLKFAGEPVDVTADEDNGWRTLLDDPGTRSVEIGINGASKETSLLSTWFQSGLLQQITIEDEVTGDTITGSFFLASVQLEGPVAGAIPFAAELMSSGTVTFTPGP